MIVSAEAEEGVVLGEGNSNPHTEAAVSSFLILRGLIWGCTEGKVKRRFPAGLAVVGSTA